MVKFFNWLSYIFAVVAVGMSGSKTDHAQDSGTDALYIEPDLEKEPEVFSEQHKYITDQEALSTPWAMFEILGFADDQVKVEFHWNKPFIENIKGLGFEGETEEDAVQLFFYASQMKPTSLNMVVEDQEIDKERGDFSQMNDGHSVVS